MNAVSKALELLGVGCGKAIRPCRAKLAASLSNDQERLVLTIARTKAEELKDSFGQGVEDLTERSEMEDLGEELGGFDARRVVDLFMGRPRRTATIVPLDPTRFGRDFRPGDDLFEFAGESGEESGFDETQRALNAIEEVLRSGVGESGEVPELQDQHSPFSQPEDVDKVINLLGHLVGGTRPPRAATRPGSDGASLADRPNSGRRVPAETRALNALLERVQHTMRYSGASRQV